MLKIESIIVSYTEGDDMGKVILVTGGSRSGKSDFAEELLKEEDNVLYIATAIATDKEMEARIDRHKAKRNCNWSTYEGYKNLADVVKNFDGKDILLDCVTVMVTNLMFEEERDFDKMAQGEIDEIEKHIEREFNVLIEAIKNLNKNMVMVTNEVGSGLVPEYKLGRIFRDIAGRINQNLGRISDEVYLVTCGIPLKVKGAI